MGWSRVTFIVSIKKATVITFLIVVFMIELIAIAGSRMNETAYRMIIAPAPAGFLIYYYLSTLELDKWSFFLIQDVEMFPLTYIYIKDRRDAIEWG